MKLKIIFFVCGLLFFQNQVMAKDNLENADKNIEITSDEMVSDSKTNLIIFTGNVVITRDDLTVKSDRVEIVNQDGTRDNISAIGNVRVKQKEINASAEKGVFYEKEGKIILTGNARAWEADNSIEGGEIILLIKENKAMVKGNQHKRVKAIYKPKEEKKP